MKDYLCMCVWGGWGVKEEESVVGSTWVREGHYNDEVIKDSRVSRPSPSFKRWFVN